MRNTYFFLGLLIAFLLLPSIKANAQFNPLGRENTIIGLDRQNGVIIMIALGIGSYFFTKNVPEEKKAIFYQLHFAFFEGDGYKVYMQNFGVEREYSNWFSLRAEGNIQEFIKENDNTFGLGFKLYSRYTAFGSKKISPFFEYGSGLFMALKQFPSNGSRFTFNLTYTVGLEFTLRNKNKIRAVYNFIHHSNANIGRRNPGFDANGVSISFSWFLE
jgi:hypothetical protein